MNKSWKFMIPNPVYRLMYWLRNRRAVKKWNEDAISILELAETSVDSNASFKWGLVWQEVWMWISIARTETVCDEFDFLCDRRGFDLAQRHYLKEMMKHVWLWDDKLYRSLQEAKSLSYKEEGDKAKVHGT